ncbi:translation initiation factor IF-2 [Triticum aestivum]|uniref:translation initiation factor IF-2 n=1 Tax=Triticum aestivum TaxID=4565 RepID=UPI001D031D90|nr:translation initiation factor IF-2-like [Triticum aestivum]
MRAASPDPPVKLLSTPMAFTDAGNGVLASGSDGPCPDPPHSAPRRSSTTSPELPPVAPASPASRCSPPLCVDRAGQLRGLPAAPGPTRFLSEPGQEPMFR